MRKFSLLLLSGLFIGIASYAGRDINNPQMGNDSQKGPPGIKAVELACLNGANRTTANHGTSNDILLPIKLGKVNINELSDDVINSKTTYFKKLNQSVGYKANDSI